MDRDFIFKPDGNVGALLNESLHSAEHFAL